MFCIRISQKHYAWDPEPMNKGVAAAWVFAIVGSGIFVPAASLAHNQKQTGRTVLGRK
jgi:hypothetical protein